jgi:gliding motility-associated-like protein
MDQKIERMRQNLFIVIDSLCKYTHVFLITVSMLSIPPLANGATVVSVTPAFNAQQVAAASNITVVFDATVTAAQVSMATFRVSGQQTGIIAGTFTGMGTNTITFDPTQDFRAGEVITVTLTTGLDLTTGRSWQFTVATAVGTANFVPRTPITTSVNTPQSVFSADVDGDGDLDVLSASNGDNKIAWYENDGAENFIAHTITTAAARAVSVYAADVDGDRDMDVLSASSQDDKIAWYENDGSENFTTRVITISADGASHVRVADFDSDGDLDVLAIAGGSPAIVWYENDGFLAFTPHTIKSSVAGTVTPADMDADGDLDVLEGSKAWYENNGSGTFTEHAIGNISYHPSYPTDLDGDGDMDVVSTLGSGVSWYENNGAQSFTHHLIQSLADLTYDVYAADLDGDGDQDVVMGGATYQQGIEWFENDGSENFTRRMFGANAMGVFSAYAADVDGDGDLDLLSASFADNKIAWHTNNLPPAIAGAHASQPVADNATIAPFATLTLSDRDAGQVLTVSVLLDDAAKGSFTAASVTASGFTDAGSGIYTFSGTASAGQTALRLLMFEPAADRVAIGASETASFTVTADDHVSPATTDNITSVIVNGVNDAPSFTEGNDVAVNEDATAQSVAGWATNLSAGPANESSQSLTFQVSNDNNALFSTQPAISASGTLTYTPAVNAWGVATVTVGLQDDGGTANGGVDESAAITFTITLKAVNDIPSFTKGADVGGNEDDAAQTVTGWATSVSAGPANESGQTLSFQVSNDNHTLFSTQPAIDASGALTFTPAADAWGSATVTVVLTDDGGTADGGVDESAAITFALTLDAVNDAPSFTKGADVAVNEDAPVQSITGWATNLSTGPADEAGQLLSFQVTNDNNTVFSVQPAIDASGTLTFTPAADASGEVAVTVVLQDDGGTANGGVDESPAITFTLSILPSNRAPSFTKGADVAVNEDATAQSVTGWATNLSAGPANESGQSLSFQVSNDNTNLFSTQPAVNASGLLTFTPAPDAWGVATVTVVLHDDGGTANGGIDQSAPAIFTITLNPVNDAPHVNPMDDVRVTVNSEPFLVTITGLDPGPGESSQQLTVVASSNAPSLLADPTVTLPGNGTATLQLAPEQGTTGVAIITVVIRDNGGTALSGQDETSITFALTVEDGIQHVFIPTLFSPNGDGANDVFRVRASGVADIRFCVYSADGHEVFRTTDVATATESGWNGVYQGRDMPAGTYTWTLQGHYSDGSALINGSQPRGQVVLLR